MTRSRAQHLSDDDGLGECRATDLAHAAGREGSQCWGEPLLGRAADSKTGPAPSSLARAGRFTRCLAPLNDGIILTRAREG